MTAWLADVTLDYWHMELLPDLMTQGHWLSSFTQRRFIYWSTEQPNDWHRDQSVYN
jgi:hypothetical protein